MVSYAMPSEGSKVFHIHLRFPALPYTDWDFSGIPESYHNIMYTEQNYKRNTFVFAPIFHELN